MTVAEVTSRIAEIQSLLASISGTSSTGSTDSTGSTASSDTTSGTDFAQALSSASGSTDADTTTVGSTGTSSTVTGNDVVTEAEKYLGVPYVWGGESSSGLDCSGLVQLTYKNLGIDVPRTAKEQVMSATRVSSLADAQPGDLLGFGSSTSTIHHVGIYIGNGQMIEAPHTGAKVRITKVYETPVAIGRVLSSSAASSATTSGTATASSVSSSTPYAAYFNAAGAKYGISPKVLSAVAKAESSYNASAVSGAGAQGLMQLMPATARSLGVTNSFDPQQAINGAAKLLSGLQDRFGSTELALAAYNAGSGAVIKYGGVPPYAETQNYVKKIMNDLGSDS